MPTLFAPGAPSGRALPHGLPRDVAGHDATMLIEAIKLPASLVALATQRATAGDPVHLLDSALQGQGEGRWSVLALETARQAQGIDAVLAVLARPDVAQPRTTPLPTDAPAFVGGWMFFLPYEAAWAFEPSLGATPEGGSALTAFAVEVTAALVVDHQCDRAWLVARDADIGARASRTLAELDLRARQQAAGGPSAFAPGRGTLDSSDPDAYRDAVRHAKRYIRDGETFQLNLSRGWRFRAAVGNGVQPAIAYTRLRAHNPAPFACWFDLPGASILSSSPERLVRVADGIVQVCPIAGTRPRGANVSDDEALRHELRNDPKEIAEHVMLVDLMRNDLGRVAATGSVRVPDLLRIESYARVHHLVSTVEARLRPATTATDVLRAVFPGGTITGCPKIQSIRRILELEGGEARGAYTGAVGYLGDDGRFDSNILIRTIVLRDGELYFRTGAGIVADSDPDRELAETGHKAQALLEAIEDDGAATVPGDAGPQIDAVSLR